MEIMLLLKRTTGAVKIQVQGEGEYNCVLTKMANSDGITQASCCKTADISTPVTAHQLNSILLCFKEFKIHKNV